MTTMFWLGLSTALAAALPDKDKDGFDAGSDCDDNDSSVFPGAAEACDGIDNDCDREWDEGTTLLGVFPDNDGDGFGDAADRLVGCAATNGKSGYYVVQGLGYPTMLRDDLVLDGRDCDDGDLAINPLAKEVCDGADNDCDSTVDEGCPIRGTGDTGVATKTGSTADTGAATTSPMTADTGRGKPVAPPSDDPAPDESGSGCIATGGSLSAIVLPLGLLAFRRRSEQD